MTYLQRDMYDEPTQLQQSATTGALVNLSQFRPQPDRQLQSTKIQETSERSWLGRRRRLQVFVFAFVCLALLLWRQQSRLAFWEQRHQEQLEALAFSGEGLDVGFVEQLTPHASRWILRVPPWRMVRTRPVIDRGSHIEPRRSYQACFTTSGSEGHLQLVSYLVVGREGFGESWWGQWTSLSGIQMESGMKHDPLGPSSDFLFADKNAGWRMESAVRGELRFVGDGTYFLPLYVNDVGHVFGLEVVEEPSGPPTGQVR